MLFARINICSANCSPVLMVIFKGPKKLCRASSYPLEGDLVVSLSLFFCFNHLTVFEEISVSSTSVFSPDLSCLYCVYPYKATSQVNLCQTKHTFSSQDIPSKPQYISSSLSELFIRCGFLHVNLGSYFQESDVIFVTVY